MKYFKLELLFCLSLLFFCSCSDDDENAGLSSGELIAFDSSANYKGSHEIPLQQAGSLEFCQVKGVLQSDEFVVRNAATGEDLYLDWGYKYAGIVGDEFGNYQRSFTSDTILVGLGFRDDWSIGDYDLLLVRDGAYQTLDRFNFCVLKNVDVDLSQKQGGVIKVTADGWLDIVKYGVIDSLEFVNKATGEIVQKVASTFKASDNVNYMLVQFDHESYPSGEYEMWIGRWGYSFRQKLCEFDIFQYAFVNSNPITQDADGNYYIQFFVDKIKEGYSYLIVDQDERYYEEIGDLDASNWDPETKIYRLKLNDESWTRKKKDGLVFNVVLTIDSFDIVVAGNNRLQLSE